MKWPVTEDERSAETEALPGFINSLHMALTSTLSPLAEVSLRVWELHYQRMLEINSVKGQFLNSDCRNGTKSTLNSKYVSVANI